MTPRIASLLASATEIVCELGLADHLVAISHECDHPPEVLDRPRVSRPRFDPSGLDSGAVDRAVREAMAEHGSVYEVDGKTLAALEPDLILTQAICEVCAVPAPGVEDLVAARGLGARVLPVDSHTVEEILQSIQAVARAAGEPDRAGGVLEALRQRLQAVKEAVEGAEAPRVLAVEWLDPPFSPGHWVPEMVELAGGVNVLGEVGAPSRQVSWDELEGLDPDVLVIMPCGYDLEASTVDAQAHQAHLVSVAPRAVKEGRAYVVDGSAYFNRSGPRILTGIEILAGLFHPRRFPAPAPDTAATWRPESVEPSGPTTSALRPSSGSPGTYPD